MYSLALSLQPDYEKARVRRARVYMAQEKWEEALDDLRKSGREQKELEADIQKCIDELGKATRLGGAEIDFGDDSEDDAAEKQEEDVQKVEGEEKTV